VKCVNVITTGPKTGESSKLESGMAVLESIKGVSIGFLAVLESIIEM